MLANKSFWFCLEPFVYVSIKNNDAIVYNTLNGKYIEVINNTLIINLLKKLISKNNLYVININEEEINEPSIFDFISKIRAFFMGDLIDASWSEKKPIQMMPMHYIKGIKPSLSEIKNSSITTASDYLTEVSLFVNSGDNDIKFQNKQFLFCPNDFECNNELSIKKIYILFQSIKTNHIQFNIIGNNIFHYSRFEELINIFKEKNIRVSFYTNYQNSELNLENLNVLKSINSHLNISVSQQINEIVLCEIIKLLKEVNISYSFNFKIESVKDVNNTEQIISKFNIQNYSFLPFFNGKNIKFFQDAVFLTKDDIIEAHPSQKEIYARMSINQINFGNLFILPNSNVYSNFNTSKLGELGINSISDLIYKEIENGTNWMRLRKNVSPCKSCIYNCLCPPLTNYEYVIGRNNLCNLKNI